MASSYLHILLAYNSENQFQCNHLVSYYLVMYEKMAKLDSIIRLFMSICTIYFRTFFWDDVTKFWDENFSQFFVKFILRQIKI